MKWLRVRSTSEQTPTLGFTTSQKTFERLDQLRAKGIPEEHARAMLLTAEEVGLTIAADLAKQNKAMEERLGLQIVAAEERLGLKIVLATIYVVVCFLLVLLGLPLTLFGPASLKKIIEFAVRILTHGR